MGGSGAGWITFGVCAASGAATLGGALRGADAGAIGEFSRAATACSGGATDVFGMDGGGADALAGTLAEEPGAWRGGAEIGGGDVSSPSTQSGSTAPIGS
jgi:hypothetical protein